MVACDLDGTLLRSDGTLSRRTIAAIAAIQAAGWDFVMVTGRPARRVVSIAEEAELTGIALCSNGALAFDLESRAMVDGQAIDPGTAAALITDLRQAIEGVAFAFELGLMFGREETYPLRPIEREMRTNALVEERIGDALELASSPVHKLIVGHALLDFEELLRAVAATAGERAEVTYSERVFVEVSAPGVTKASGVKVLAARLRVDVRDVVAIGDMPNDLPMLAWAGRGVAVANAHPEVVAAADLVVATNDDDGVAVLLEGLAAGG